MDSTVHSSVGRPEKRVAGPKSVQEHQLSEESTKNVPRVIMAGDATIGGEQRDWIGTRKRRSKRTT